MIESSVSRILSLLSSSDKVLDVGGWACPFNRANYVMDAEPYETRGFYATFGAPASQGGNEEHFTAQTWIQRDICAREPFPFKDKELDFAICSQTLEDLRDPLWVCSELVRVAKRGYIEVPSRIKESCRGWESPRIVGLSHHRWLIEARDNHLSFLMKSHMIHSHWRFSFPPSFLRTLPEEKMETSFFWDDSFTYSETTIHGVDELAADLEAFVRSVKPYPEWQLKLSHGVRWMEYQKDRATGKARRLLFPTATS